jgi:hypothetical protein
MENTTKQVKVSQSSFTTDVNNGVGKSELVKKYGISSASVKAIATQLNLTIKRTVTPKYVLTNDTYVQGTENKVTEFALNN